MYSSSSDKLYVITAVGTSILVTASIKVAVTTSIHNFLLSSLDSNLFIFGCLE